MCATLSTTTGTKSYHTTSDDSTPDITCWQRQHAQGTCKPTTIALMNNYANSQDKTFKRRAMNSFGVALRRTKPD